MVRKGSLLLLAFVLSVGSYSPAQIWSGILDPTKAIDWASYSGIPGGIPTNRTQCGSTIAAGASSTTIQSALNSCAANTYVLLGPGTFTLSSAVTIPSNKTLRGSGTQNTIVNCGFDDCINVGGTGALSSTTLINITSGATQGSTSIVVASTSGISVGGYLEVSELNNSADPWYATISGTNGSCGWCDQWGGVRTRGQIVEVTSITGTTIGISPPLYSDYTLTPAVTPFAATTKYAGLEALQLYMTKTSYDGSLTANIYMDQCAYCWIKGVEDNYANGDHVQVGSSFRCEIRDSYFSNSLNHTSGQTEGSIFIINKSSGILVENNIIERSHDSVVEDWGPAGNVIAYNYMFGNFDTNYPTSSPAWSIDTHGAHPQFTLMEGNVGSMIVVDSIWGSGSHDTMFRNWMNDMHARCSPLANGRNNIDCSTLNYQSAELVGFWISGQHHSNNLVANVAGSAVTKAHTTEVAEQIGGSDTSSWNNAVDFSLGTDPSDSTVLSTSLVFGNYRNADNNLTWERNVPSGYNPPHPSQTLPASFIHSSQPSWWGTTIPWPAIGPDVTGGAGPGGHVYSLTAANPSQACYNATPKGSDGIALFDPTVCYGGSQSGGGGGAPTAPTGLSAVVQ